jgi:tRNA threonylcarbamoyladenosine biosynthesis protein TsaB
VTKVAVRLLAITTSTPRFEAAFLEGEVARTRSYEGEKAHAERMFAEIDAALAGADRKSLDAIACDVGPGSFTGIRVGLAAAKGIALALGIPLVPITSLEALSAAARLSGAEGPIVAVLDARRGEIFVQRFDGSERGEAHHVPRSAIRDLLRAQPDALFCGLPLGAGERRLAENVEGAESPSAAVIARLARDRTVSAPPLELVEPVYLRPPDAKLPAHGDDPRR